MARVWSPPFAPTPSQQSPHASLPTALRGGQCRAKQTEAQRGSLSSVGSRNKVVAAQPSQIAHAWTDWPDELSGRVLLAPGGHIRTVKGDCPAPL